MRFVNMKRVLLVATLLVLSAICFAVKSKDRPTSLPNLVAPKLPQTDKIESQGSVVSDNRVFTRRPASKHSPPSDAPPQTQSSNDLQSPQRYAFSNGPMRMIVGSRPPPNTNRISEYLALERYRYDEGRKRIAELQQLSKGLKTGMTKQDVVDTIGELPSEQTKTDLTNGIINYFTFSADPDRTRPMTYENDIEFLRVLFDRNDRAVEWYVSHSMNLSAKIVVP